MEARIFRRREGCAADFTEQGKHLLPDADGNVPDAAEARAAGTRADSHSSYRRNGCEFPAVAIGEVTRTGAFSPQAQPNSDEVGV